MKWTTFASAIASKSRDAQVYCQFHTGEISAQPPCSAALSRSWSSPITLRRLASAERAGSAPAPPVVERRHVDQHHPAVEDRRPAQPQRLERSAAGPASATAMLSRTAASGCAPDVDLEERREVAALHEDVRVEIEDPPVLPGERRRQRQPEIGRLRPPRVLPQPVEDARRSSTRQIADAETRRDPRRRDRRGHADADVEVPPGASARDLAAAKMAKRRYCPSAAKTTARSARAGVAASRTMAMAYSARGLRALLSIRRRGCRARGFLLRALGPRLRRPHR